MIYLIVFGSILSYYFMATLVYKLISHYIVLGYGDDDRIIMAIFWIAIIPLYIIYRSIQKLTDFISDWIIHRKGL